MGKRQHQKDKMYITCTEYTHFYGGKRAGELLYRSRFLLKLLTDSSFCSSYSRDLVVCLAVD
uniref:Uncharacterized protein n=1 Tax=Amphiprion ocellaris TaxID=80972 RepID=A0AAQ5YMK0_AMPOC